MSVRSAVVASLFCAIAGAIVAGQASGAASPDEIDKAIKKGVGFLYSVQGEHGDWDFILKPSAEGKWPGDVKQTCGPTALAVYALLTAGENPKDPRIVKAYDYLKKTQTGGTYAIGFRANAYALFPISDEVKRLLAGDANWIKTSFQLGKDVKRRGFYGYGSAAKSGYDRSTSQAAVLGAWACAQIGDSFGSDYWRIIEESWRKAQFEDGGWNYNEWLADESMAMTASGVATLFITQEYLHLADFSECKGSAFDPAIEKGLKWIGTNFDRFHEKWPFYTVFAIERCGAASGYRYFGEHDWFAEGADWLIKQQAENGSWEGDNNASTSFALLFLGRGRAPVAVNKLQYGASEIGPGSNVAAPTGANWNQRPRDVPNICRWTGRQQERTLNFQIVSIDSPADSFSDAPIMYISGNQPLKFSEEKVAKLKKYIEEGGMLLGNADCSSKPFVEAFKKLGTEMFPSYEWRVLPPDHPMFEQFPAKAWKTPPNLQALSNGARELMVLYASGDPGKYWQLHMLGGHEEMHQSMADVLAYAVDRETVRFKGVSHIVRPDPEKPAERTIKLARLKYPGNWDPEPGAWRRMAAIAHNQQRIDIDIQTVDLGGGKLDKSYHLAHLTGTAAYTLTDPQKQELKKYVEDGGTLLVDACGGASAFAASIEPELSTLFAGGKPAIDVLPATHKLYSSDYVNAPKFEQVEYRPFARKVLGLEMKLPQVRGVEINGRTAVLFSREDLTAGMVGESIGGILGYAPKSATAIVQHLLISIAPAKTEQAAKTDENKPAEGTTPTPTESAAKPAPAAEKPPEAPKPPDAPANPPQRGGRRRPS
jgi:hypothetical protein